MAKRKSQKEIIADALEDLLLSNSFERITVSEIAGKCNISRMTFYRYYRDKYECMNWVYQNRIQHIVEENDNLTSWKTLIYQIAVFLYDRRAFFTKVNYYKEQNSLIECIYYCGMDYAMGLLKREYDPEAVPREIYYLVHMYMTGSVEGINKWLQEDCEGGPEFLAEVQSNAMPMELRKYFT